MIAVIVFLLILIDNMHGITYKARTCNKKTLTTELVWLFHILIMTYSILSPFILKDYISNLMFNVTMLLSWFLFNKVNGKAVCILSVLENKICENEEQIRVIPTEYIVLITGIILYDIYMLLRS